MNDGLGARCTVLVGGFLAPRSSMPAQEYWGCATRCKHPPWRTIVAHPSPVASLRPRLSAVL